MSIHCGEIIDDSVTREYATTLSACGMKYPEGEQPLVVVTDVLEDPTGLKLEIRIPTDSIGADRLLKQLGFIAHSETQKKAAATKKQVRL